MAANVTLRDFSTTTFSRYRIPFASLHSKMHNAPYCHEFNRVLVDLAWVRTMYPDDHLVVATREARLISYLGGRDDLSFISTPEIGDKMNEKGITVHKVTWSVINVVDRARGILESHSKVVLCFLDPIVITGVGVLRESDLSKCVDDLEKYAAVVVCWECPRGQADVEIPSVERFFWNPYAKAHLGSILTLHTPSELKKRIRIGTSDEWYDGLTYHKVMCWVSSPAGEIGGEVALDLARSIFFQEKGCKSGDCRQNESDESIVRRYCLKNKLPEPIVYVYSTIDDLTKSPIFRMIGVIGNVKTPEWVSADEQFARNHVWHDLREVVLPASS
uniref:Uncharacterized protein n=1 Tax=Calla Lily Valley virus TaxID=3139873 RepID=A0AAN0LK88_9VIRU